MRLYAAYYVFHFIGFADGEDVKHKVKSSTMAGLYKDKKVAIKWCEECHDIKSKVYKGKITEKIGRKMLQDIGSALANDYNYHYVEVIE